MGQRAPTWPAMGKQLEVGLTACPLIQSLEQEPLPAQTHPSMLGPTGLPTHPFSTRQGVGVGMGAGRGEPGSEALAWGPGCLPRGWEFTWALAPRTSARLVPSAQAPYPRFGQVRRSFRGAPFLSPEPGGEGQGGAHFQEPHSSRQRCLQEPLLPRTTCSPGAAATPGAPDPCPVRLPLPHFQPVVPAWATCLPHPLPFPIPVPGTHHRPLPGAPSGWCGLEAALPRPRPSGESQTPGDPGGPGRELTAQWPQTPRNSEGVEPPGRWGRAGVGRTRAPPPSPGSASARTQHRSRPRTWKVPERSGPARPRAAHLSASKHGFFAFKSELARAKNLRLAQQAPHISPGKRGSQPGACNTTPCPPPEMLPQLSVCSERVSGEPEPEPVGEELWEQEMERLCSSREPVRALPYAMVDKRFIRMVKGLPQKLFLGQEYKSPLSAKVFSSWDFCIQGEQASTIKKHEISNEFKVELEEGHRFLLEQQQTRAQRVCHLLTYLRVNILIGLLVVGAISAIFWATKYSQDNKEESLFVLLQYLPPGVIALVNFLGPLLFVFLVQLENYSPNTEVNLTLMWCVVLKLASLGMFSFSLGQTVLCIGRNKTSCKSYGYDACDYQCWENSVGEELYKLSIFNFLLTVAFAFLVTLPRRLLVERFSGPFWAWLGREEFLVPKNVLDIVAGQTVTWMGLFYCPLLPLLNSAFIFLTFQIKKVAHGLGGSRGCTCQQSGAYILPHTAPPHLRGPQTPGICKRGSPPPPCCCLLPVHPPAELHGIPSAIPRLQLHLLLPAGAHPGPAPGHCAPGLCGQQVREQRGGRLASKQLLTQGPDPAHPLAISPQRPLLLGLRPLHQLLSPLAGGPGAGGPPAPTPRPACPPLPRLPCLQLPPPHPAQVPLRTTGVKGGGSWEGGSPSHAHSSMGLAVPPRPLGSPHGASPVKQAP
uniref:Transmembrane channel-like protein n=1 Tax=Equus asinus asinus TaxID=83772 RepID=A0A8C4L7G1_EQUAS